MPFKKKLKQIILLCIPRLGGGGVWGLGLLAGPGGGGGRWCVGLLGGPGGGGGYDGGKDGGG